MKKISTFSSVCEYFLLLMDHRDYHRASPPTLSDRSMHSASAHSRIHHIRPQSANYGEPTRTCFMIQAKSFCLAKKDSTSALAIFFYKLADLG